MSNNVEYARRYIHGVADGNAFSDYNRCLPKAGKNNSSNYYVIKFEGTYSSIHVISNIFPMLD